MLYVDCSHFTPPPAPDLWAGFCWYFRDVELLHKGQPGLDSKALQQQCGWAGWRGVRWGMENIEPEGGVGETLAQEPRSGAGTLTPHIKAEGEKRCQKLL